MPTSSQASQTACAAGTYQASTGQSSCDDADAGYYVTGTAQTSQTACAAGTYQASTGQSSCDDADAGYYVPSSGQSSQTACAAGTFSSTTGSARVLTLQQDILCHLLVSLVQPHAVLDTIKHPPVKHPVTADAGYYVSSSAQKPDCLCCWNL